MDLKIIYEDGDVLVVDKPAGMVIFEERINPSSLNSSGPFLINELIKSRPELKNVGEAPRYGIVHRLDKDTSGILLVAKNSEVLIFLQKQFKSREVDKKYIALVTGVIKEDSGVVHTLMGRSPQDPRKQKCYPLAPNTQHLTPNKREAITEYKVLERFPSYTLLDVTIKTGRKHQIRCHLTYIHHPIIGDKMYGFKDSPILEGLDRQFLHATTIKIKLPSGGIKEFKSDLPEELQKILKELT